MQTIYVANKSALVTASELDAACNAINKQLLWYFSKWWPVRALLTPATGTLPANAETITLVDKLDVAGALGYHDDTPAGVPYGLVDVKASQDAGDFWSATLSHEVLEQEIDPYCDDTTISPWQGKSAALALEVCDPVENDEYPVDGVYVSNFVTQTWFVQGSTQRADWLGKLKAPLTLSPGGYQSYTNDLTTWQQTFGDAPKPHQKTPLPGSRRWRRHSLPKLTCTPQGTAAGK